MTMMPLLTWNLLPFNLRSVHMALAGLRPNVGKRHTASYSDKFLIWKRSLKEKKRGVFSSNSISRIELDSS